MVYHEGIFSRARPEQVCQPPVCEACLGGGRGGGGMHPRFTQQCWKASGEVTWEWTDLSGYQKTEKHPRYTHTLEYLAKRAWQSTSAPVSFCELFFSTPSDQASLWKQILKANIS